MYIQVIRSKTKNKTYSSTILAENYRQNGKVRRRIISNLSRWPKPLIEQFKLLLKGGQVSCIDDLVPQQGKAFAGLYVINQICKQIGITKALGKNKNAHLALFQIMGRILCPGGSRLYLTTQWRNDQAIEEVLGLTHFSEDSLYTNLGWLSDHQAAIEDMIFRFNHPDKALSTVYLYDATSTYFEGQKNEMAAYGLDRDNKKGKKQIIIGLLCDQQGYPASVEVFPGNTADMKTLANQLKKLKERFGIKRVVFVGDKGMIKSTQIESIHELEWNYITSITKAQIQSLIKNETFQMELFDTELSEVEDQNVRYLLRRNPDRAKEIGINRNSKIQYVINKIKEKNQYLKAHPRAKVETAWDAIQKMITGRKLKDILECSIKGRQIKHHINEKQKQQVAKLDGCYVIKTDVPAHLADKNVIHDRYKDLALVEQAFRTIKRAFEEIHPVYVRKEKRTRGHVFVCMLAYLVIKHVWEKAKHLGYTQQYIFETLDKIQYSSYKYREATIKVIPKILQPHQQQILDAIGIKLPDKL